MEATILFMAEIIRKKQHPPLTIHLLPLLKDVDTMHSSSSPFQSMNLTQGLRSSPYIRQRRREDMAEISLSLFPYTCNQQKISPVPLCRLGKQHPLAVAASTGSPTTLTTGSDARATGTAMSKHSSTIPTCNAPCPGRAE